MALDQSNPISEVNNNLPTLVLLSSEDITSFQHDAINPFVPSVLNIGRLTTILI